MQDLTQMRNLVLILHQEEQDLLLERIKQKNFSLKIN